MNFWENLKKPIMILAPMDDVTDTVFRQIITTTGKPDVFFTEFTNVDALCSRGREKVMDRLRFKEEERPIVAQIWGNDPEKFYKVAQNLQELKFDGIDINMGCPATDMTKNGSCSALIKNPTLATEIIQATQEGAKNLPVSVKTRIGFNSIITDEWTQTLLKQNLAALILHFRTTREMSKVAAHWDQAKIAVDIRNQMHSKTLIIGNGDVKSLAEAKSKALEYQIDGVMIGRGIFENVWLFNEQLKFEDITIQDRFDILLQHLELFKNTWGDTKNPAIMKKFVKCYINGFDGAANMRNQLMETTTLEELKTLTISLMPNA